MAMKIEIGSWTVQVLAQSVEVSEEDLIKGAATFTLEAAAVIVSEGRRLELLRSRWLLRTQCGLACDPAKSGDGDLLWPQGKSGSLTHKKGHVAAVVDDTNEWRSLGLDLESRAISEKIGSKVLVAEEFERLKDIGGLGEQIAAAFAAKEAIFKAVFPIGRQMFWFHDAVIREVEVIDAHAKSLRFVADVGVVAGGPAEWNRQCEVFLQAIELDQKLYWLAVCGISSVAHKGGGTATSLR